ncbi:carboxypeptidase regulatory-like domain-containing protein [Chloroflexi bacterium TSY]|nr:carboxypeptidase regulatory-like domain-containing protein [Chloroflexi bacterium TSY]
MRETASVTFSANSQQVLFGGKLGNLHIWDVATATYVNTLLGHTGQVFDLVALSNSGEILSVGEDGTLRRWPVADPPAAYADPTNSLRWVSEIALSPDGTQLLTLAPNGFGTEPRLWNVETGTIEHIFTDVTTMGNDIIFNHDGREAFSVHGNQLYRWDVASRTLIHTLTSTGLTGLNALARSADSATLVVGGSRGAALYRYDESRGTYVQSATLSGFSQPVNAVAITADGHRFATATTAEIVLWNSADGTEIARYTDPVQFVGGMAFAPDGETLAIGSRRPALWNTTSGRIQPITTQGRTIVDLAWHNDVLMLVNQAGTLSAYNTQTLNEIATWEREPGIDFSAVALARGNAVDGMVAVAGTNAGQVVVFDLAEHAHKMLFRGGQIFTPEAIELTADGTHFITAGFRDGRALIYNTTTRQIEQTLRVPARQTNVYAASLSADGSLAATGGIEGVIHLWQVSDGTLLHALRHPTPNVTITALRFSADGRYLVTGDNGNGVHLWDVAARTHIRSFAGHTDVVDAVMISTDNSLILSGGRDNLAYLFDANTGAVRSTLSHDDDVTAVDLSASAQVALTIGKDGAATLWDVATGSAQQTLHNRYDVVDNQGRKSTVTVGLTAGAFSADERYIVTGDDNGVAQVWTVQEGQLLRTFEGHGNPIVAVAFDVERNQVIVAGTLTGEKPTTLLRHALHLPDALASGPGYRNREGDAGSIQALAVSPSGQHLAAATCNGYATVWHVDGSNGPVQIHGGGASACVWFVAFTPDGNEVLVGDTDEVGLYRVDNGDLIYRLSPHRWAIRGVAFSPDGRLLATGGGDFGPGQNCQDNCGSVKIYNGISGELIHTIPYPFEVTALEFVDERTLLVGSADGNVAAWDAATGQLGFRYPNAANKVTQLTVSPTGHYFLMDSHANMVLLRDLRTGDVLHTYMHAEPVQDIAFHPNGEKFVVSAGHNATIWQLDGTMVTAYGSLETVHTARYSADGSDIYVAGGNNGDDFVQELIGTDKTTDETVYTIRGRVTNSAGAPVAGALITSAEQSTTTTADGTYQLEGLLTGTYPVRATHSDTIFTPGEKLVTLPGANEANFSEVALYTITGRAIDSNGRPLADVVVRTDGQETATSDNGTYALIDLAAGRQVVRADHLAYTFAEGQKTVTLSSADSTVNFVALLDESPTDDLNNRFYLPILMR